VPILASFASPLKRKSRCETQFSCNKNITRLPYTRRRSLAVDLLLALSDRISELRREGCDG
jgi:hypothetical protein